MNKLIIATGNVIQGVALKLFAEHSREIEHWELVTSLDELIRSADSGEYSLLLLADDLLKDVNDEIIRLLKEKFINAKIIVLANKRIWNREQELRVAGADYVVYSDEAEKLLQEIFSDNIQPQHTSVDLDKAWGPMQCYLNDNELDFLYYLCHGLRFEEIAKHLNVTKRTISYYEDSMLQKTGCESIWSLLAEATNKLFNERYKPNK